MYYPALSSVDPLYEGRPYGYSTAPVLQPTYTRTAALPLARGVDYYAAVPSYRSSVVPGVREVVPVVNSEWTQLESLARGNELLRSEIATVRRQNTQLLGGYVDPTLPPAVSVAPVSDALGSPLATGLGLLTYQDVAWRRDLARRAADEDEQRQRNRAQWEITEAEMLRQMGTQQQLLVQPAASPIQYSGDRPVCLHIKIINGSKLAPLDVKTSDPFVEICVDGRPGPTTSTQSRTLDPIWKEDFYLEVPPQVQNILLRVWDYDRQSSHDFMGQARLDVTNRVSETLTLPLELRDANDRRNLSHVKNLGTAGSLGTLSVWVDWVKDFTNVSNVFRFGDKGIPPRPVGGAPKTTLSPKMKATSPQVAPAPIPPVAQTAARSTISGAFGSGINKPASQTKKANRVLVKILGGSKIAAKDYKASDPYVEIFVNDKSTGLKTKVVPNSANPVWNEDFFLDLPATAKTIALRVFDYDVQSSADFLGQVLVDVKAQPSGSQQLPLALRGAKGSAENLADRRGLSHVRNLDTVGGLGYLNFLIDWNPDGAVATRSLPSGTPTCLRLRVVSGTAIEMKDFMGLKKPDPYVTVGLDGQLTTAKTKYVDSTNAPQWNEEFYIDVPASVQTVNLNVWDYDMLTKDDQIGVANMSVAQRTNGTQTLAVVPSSSKSGNQGKLTVVTEWLPSTAGIGAEIHRTSGAAAAAPTGPTTVKEFAQTALDSPTGKKAQADALNYAQGAASNVNTGNATADKLVSSGAKAGFSKLKFT